MAIGERIREARRKSGLSMSALARASGLSKGFLSQVEGGTSTPSLASLTRLAGALGMALSQVLDESHPSISLSSDPQLRVLRASRLSPAPSSLAALRAMPPGSGAYFALRPTERLVGQGEPEASLGEALCLVVDGAVRFDMGEQSISIRAGDLALFTPSAQYRLACESSEARAFLFVPRPCQLPQIELAVSPNLSQKPSVAIKGPFRLVEMRAARLRARRAV